jgi:hypothetical protein
VGAIFVYHKYGITCEDNMAVLSSKTTSGEESFTKYVEKNPRYGEIEFEVEEKMTAGLITKAGSQYKVVKELKAGETFKITSNAVQMVGNIRCAAVKYKSMTGFIPLNRIRKPTKGNGTQYEDDVVDELNRIFLEIGRPIDIKVKDKTFKNLCFAVKVDTAMKRSFGAKADPKADIIICENKSQPFKGTPIYISHKKEGGPEAFQQYGGLSEKAGKAIQDHPEVQEFLSKVSGYIENDKLSAPIMMAVKDDKLINMSIFGPDYPNAFSLQHCQVIAQGNPTLTKINENTYKLNFISKGTAAMHFSADLSHFTGGFQAVFGATFRAGRGFDYDGKRYNGARVAIYPRQLMATRTGLITL